jgi:sugar phosphate isomerase/epimerase
MYPSWNARAVGLTLGAAETLQIAAQAGFPGVDLMVRDLVESCGDPHEVRRRMDDLGLRAGAWPLPVSWRGSAAQFRDDLSNLPRYARAAALLGLHRTGTWVMPEIDPSRDFDALDDDPVTRLVVLHLDRLGQIAAILADYGSRLGLEILGPASARTGRAAPFVYRYRHLGEQLGALKDRHQNVGVLVDSFHLFAAGEECGEVLVWGGDAVVWVHLADAAQNDRATLMDHQRELPGETGWGDGRRLLQMLQAIGYDGPVTAEPLGQCKSLSGLNALAIARRSLTALRAVWPESPRGR